MVQVVHRSRRFLLAAFAIVLVAQVGAAQEDPPTRVARLNYTNGEVSMLPAGVEQWQPNELNRPFTAGDSLYVGDRSVAEFHLDNAVIRLGQDSDTTFLNLNDHVAQLRLSQGDLSIGVYGLGPDEVLEVDTSNAAVTLLRPGSYRIHVDPNAQTAYVAVHNGQAEINGDNQAFTVDEGNGVQLSGVDQLAYDVQAAPPFDVFDSWCADRDAQEQRWQADAHALPQTVIGGEDLAANGAWTESSEYGPVWSPQNVPADWAPYQDGHWAFVQPWGWTWISTASWGFAPFHYGRWVWWRNRWGWTPGPIAVRGAPLHPVYAPALVAWLGPNQPGHLVHGGNGPTVGWVPLGPGEIYTPAYHCSPSYFERVNVRNTRIVRTVNITNVYQTVYVHQTVYHQQFINQTAPHGVIVVSSAAVAAGHPIRTAVMAPRQNGLAQLRTESVLRPAVQPVPTPAFRTVSGRPIVQPDRRLEAMPVFARTRPSAAAVASMHHDLPWQTPGQPRPLAAQSKMIERKGVDGVQPLPSGRQTVKIITPVQPVPVHAGMHNGNPTGGQAPPRAISPPQAPRPADTQVRPAWTQGRQAGMSGSTAEQRPSPPAAPTSPGGGTGGRPANSQSQTTPRFEDFRRPPSPPPAQPMRQQAPQPNGQVRPSRPDTPHQLPPAIAPHRAPEQPNVTPPPHRSEPNHTEPEPNRGVEPRSFPRSSEPPHESHGNNAPAPPHNATPPNQHPASTPNTQPPPHNTPPPPHNDSNAHGTSNSKGKN